MYSHILGDTDKKREVHLPTTEKATEYLSTTSNLDEWFVSNMLHTVFRQINTLGAEAQNESLSLSDLNESHNVDTWIPEL